MTRMLSENDPDATTPMGGFRLQAPSDYVDLGEMLRQLALPTVLVQEGGYALGLSKDSDTSAETQTVSCAVDAVLCGAAR